MTSEDIVTKVNNLIDKYGGDRGTILQDLIEDLQFQLEEYEEEKENDEN